MRLRSFLKKHLNTLLSLLQSQESISSTKSTAEISTTELNMESNKSERKHKKNLTMFLTRKRNQKNNYGLSIYDDDLYTIALKVCYILDGDNPYAERAALFLKEISMAETHGGTYWDTTKYAGMGITQIDKIGFKDTVKRTSEKGKTIILEKFGIDLDLCEWVELRHNPILCFIITRLFIMLRPNKIPPLIEDRAAYWKKWYNTTAGKGTIEHYIEVNKGA